MPRPATDVAAARARAWHRQVLAAAGVVVVAACLLRVLPGGERVAVRGLGGRPLPHSCLTRVWFGRSCPACGLTRSIVHLAHADGPASLRAHRLGWLVALAIVAQFPYRLLALRRPGRPPIHPRLAEALGVSLVVLLVANWLFDLLR